MSNVYFIRVIRAIRGKKFVQKNSCFKVHKILVVLILIISCILAYIVHLLLKKYVDPRRSLGHLLFYMLAHFAGIFMILFLLNYLLLRYRSLLFQ